MTPVDYARQIKDSDYKDSAVLRSVKLKLDLNSASDYLDAGYDLVGKLLGDEYAEMSPETVKMFIILESFLLVFLEHASNLEMVKELMLECDC